MLLWACGCAAQKCSSRSLRRFPPSIGPLNQFEPLSPALLLRPPLHLPYPRTLFSLFLTLKSGFVAFCGTGGIDYARQVRSACEIIYL